MVTQTRCCHRFLRICRSLVVAGLVLGLLPQGRAEEPEIVAQYQARDTLSPAVDADADANTCIRQLTWKPTVFEVTCERRKYSGYKSLVRFPSPIPSGDETNDRVTMEWYPPFSETETPQPAMLVVHESGSNMAIGRLFARAMQAEGVHAFLIHLPNYGDRRNGNRRLRTQNLVQMIQQAVGDVRRGRDAIAALPDIDTSNIGVQGTSLGGFVVATSASLDHGFHRVFIMLAGGNLYDVVTKGERDAAIFRRELAAAGYEGEKLRDLLWQIEPTRVAHRLVPQNTWLYSGESDRVVPLENAIALAKAADLDSSHHIRIAANHYTAILYFATIVRQVVEDFTTR